MSRHTILVIDDEEFIRLNLQNILQEENQVILLDKGHRAMEVVGESDISLVLLDLNLQDMHGLEVLKQLKQQQPDLLVIIITGYASVESAVEALAGRSAVGGSARSLSMENRAMAKMDAYLLENEPVLVQVLVQVLVHSYFY